MGHWNEPPEAAGLYRVIEIKAPERLEYSPYFDIASSVVWYNPDLYGHFPRFVPVPLDTAPDWVRQAAGGRQDALAYQPLPGLMVDRLAVCHAREMQVIQEAPEPLVITLEMVKAVGKAIEPLGYDDGDGASEHEILDYSRDAILEFCRIAGITCKLSPDIPEYFIFL